MEILQQIFMTIVAAFVFCILIARITSAVNNGDGVDHRRRSHDYSNVVTEELKSKMEKSSSRRKGIKKVRFAVDHDEFVVNKVVAGPSETKQVVIVKNHDEDLISLNDVVTEMKSPEEELGGVEKADYDDNTAIDYDQTEKGESETSSEGTMIHDENVANLEENQMCTKLVCDDGIDEDEKEKEGLISDEDDSEDDWEGIERSELENVFAMAADYGKVDDHLQSLGSDVQMQLYGLHKVATEGHCNEAPPMALKVSARAKWNAWQKLGKMNPDVAMEHYITLLSEKLPEWSQGIHSFEVGLSSSSTSSTVDVTLKERKSEIEPCSDSVNEDKH